MKTAFAFCLLLLVSTVARASAPTDAPPLLTAADQGDLARVQQLLDGGVDVATKAENGINALNWAAYSGHVEVAKLLLARGIDVNSNNNNPGWSALMNASADGHADVVELLLSKGARVDLHAKDDWTALDYAAAKQHPDIARTLLAHGADGAASLRAMVRKGDAEGIRVLLAAGVSVDARGADGETALFAAMQSGNAELARLLLANGANPNLYPVETSNMDTPLKWAAYRCDPDIARALLAAGADKTAREGAYELAETGWTSDMKPCSADVQALLKP